MNQSTTTSSELPAQRERLHLLLAANSAMVLLAGLNAGWIGPVLPAIASENSIELAQLGSMISLQFFGCIITMSLGKNTLDLLGVRNAIRLSAILWLSGLVTLASASSLAMLSLGSVLAGAGSGVNAIASTICALRLSEGNQTGSLNRLHMFFGLGALLGPFLALGMRQTPFSYHGTFLTGALLISIILSLLLRCPDLPPPEDRQSAPASREVLSKPLLWLFALVLFFYVGVESGFTAWLFVYLTGAAHLSHPMASLGMSLLWIGLTGGRLLAGLLAHRFSARAVTINSMLLATAGTSLLVAFPSFLHLSLLFVLMIGLGFGPIFPSVVAMVNIAFNRSAALVSTIVITIGFLGGVAFPWAAGQAFTDMGSQWGMAIMLAGSLVMTALFRLTSLKSLETDRDNGENMGV